MADQPRRVRLLLSPSHPLDAEILDWLDSLPQSARGTELKPHLTAALIAYVRQQSIQSHAVSRNRTIKSKVDNRSGPPAELKSQREGTVRGSRPADTRESPHALAKQLLKDFG